jgi:hypothetical protein
MISIFNLLVLVASLVYAYINRDDAYRLTFASVLAGYVFTNLASRVAILVRDFTWPILLASTIYRWKDIRVSIAYLIAIPVDGEQLLVRGHRITTQYQPVGGVYKTYLTDAEMNRRFRASPDRRFSPDQTNQQDLRVRVPGRELHKLLRWFKERTNREIFPLREFYEELVRPGILNAEKFPYFDCVYLGMRRLPLRYDRFSQCQQLIIADVYELRPTPEQAQELRALRSRVSAGHPMIYFATREEIITGGSVSPQSTTFDIAPTAPWLLGR